MELEGDWDPLKALGPEDTPILSSVRSFLEEIEELPAQLESDVQRLPAGAVAAGFTTFSCQSQPLLGSPPLVPLLPASVRSVLPVSSVSPPLLTVQTPASQRKRH